MKQLTKLLLFASLIFIISSCSEKSIVEDLNREESYKNSQTAYTLNYSSDEVTFSELTLSELYAAPNVLSKKNYKNNVNHGAHGIVTTTSPNTLVFNAVENKSGVHGENYIDGSYFVNVKFDSESLTVLNNQAFFGGTITSWEAGPGFPAVAPPVDEGWLLYAAVEDNGEGAITADALGGVLLFLPPGTTIQSIEENEGFDPGYFAANNILSISDYMAFLYVNNPSPFEFVAGENPTNVQVK